MLFLRSEMMKYYCVQCSVCRHKQYYREHTMYTVHIYYDLRGNVPIGGLTDKKTIITRYSPNHFTLFFAVVVVVTISMKEWQEKGTKMSPIIRFIHSTVQYWDENWIFFFIGFVFVYEWIRLSSMQQINK